MAKGFLSKLFKSTQKDIPHLKKEFIAMGGEELLIPHKELIDKIYECTGVPRKTWDEMYLQLFKNGAEFIQQLPASAAHHHSERGGLLLHSLELALLCARAKSGIQYTPDNKEDQANRMKEVFSYAVISAGFLHDIGKLVTDIDIYNKSKQKKWILLLEPLPIGDEYLFQWKKDPSRSRKDHEQAGSLLITKIMPTCGIEWLLGINMDVFRKWTSSVTGHGEGYGGEIYDCIHKADIHSAKKNMINNPIVSKHAGFQKEQALTEQSISQQGTQRYYHEPFINYWSESISNGLIKMNSPGSSVWVLDDIVLLVAPLSITNAIKAIRESGKKIPADVSPNINQLKDCNVLVDFDGSGVHLFDALIDIPKKNKKKGWSGELKFIAIERELIDPQLTLRSFEGKVVSIASGEILYQKTEGDKPAVKASNVESKNATKVDPSLNIVSNEDLDRFIKDSVALDINDEIVPIESTAFEHQINNTPPLDAYVDMQQNEEQEEYYHLSDSIADLQSSSPLMAQSVSKHNSNNIIDNILASTPYPPKEKYILSEENIKSEDKRSPGSGVAFWDWLECKILMKKLELNKAQSCLHVVSRGRGAQLFLVSPAIFIDYLYEEKIVDNKIVNAPPELKSLQRGLFNLKKHDPLHGKDIIDVNVKRGGRGGIKKLNGVLLTPESTKCLFGEQYIDLRPNQFISFSS